MGLLTGYLLYKAGKNKAERKRRLDTCNRCGRDRSEHVGWNERCPE